MKTDVKMGIGTFPDSISPVFDKLVVLDGRLENCDTANIANDDLSTENIQTSRKWSCGILRLLKGGSGSQWLGCWI